VIDQGAGGGAASDQANLPIFRALLGVLVVVALVFGIGPLAFHGARRRSPVTRMTSLKGGKSPSNSPNPVGFQNADQVWGS
jgi:hypothetical protein